MRRRRAGRARRSLRAAELACWVFKRSAVLGRFTLGPGDERHREHIESCGELEAQSRTATQTATRWSGIGPRRVLQAWLASIDARLEGKEESLMPASATRRVGTQAAVEGG
jgi:hypothetical protein